MCDILDFGGLTTFLWGDDEGVWDGVGYARVLRGGCDLEGIAAGCGGGWKLAAAADESGRGKRREQGETEQGAGEADRAAAEGKTGEDRGESQGRLGGERSEGSRGSGGLVKARVTDDIGGVDVEVQGEAGAGVQRSVDGQAGCMRGQIGTGEGDLVAEAAEGGGDDREGAVVLGYEGDARVRGGEGVVGDVDDDGDGN